jgi:hypothetical protein
MAFHGILCKYNIIYPTFWLFSIYKASSACLTFIPIKAKKKRLVFSNQDRMKILFKLLNQIANVLWDKDSLRFMGMAGK